MNNMGPPFFYEPNNVASSVITPSTIHAANTGLSRFYEKYLLQKAMSVYEWKIPERWALNYMLYCLYTWGVFAITEAPGFGVIPQGCTLSGYNVFYCPAEVYISNPLFKNGLKRTPDVDCVLFHLQPNYCGIMDIISYYSAQMALASETLSTNILNSKLSYVLGATSKQGAESLKKMYDRIASGEPAVAVDKSLFNDDGSAAWTFFNQDLGSNYIGPKLIDTIRTLEQQFDTEIGIPNANTSKRERQSTDEINSNNVDTLSRADMWLKSLQECCRKAMKMFDVDISVNWRYDMTKIEEEVKEDERPTFSTRNL